MLKTDIPYIQNKRGGSMDYEKVWDELLKMAKVDIDYQRGLESLIKKRKHILRPVRF